MNDATATDFTKRLQPPEPRLTPRPRRLACAPLTTVATSRGVDASRRLAALVLSLILGGPTVALAGAPPLHQRIDAALASVRSAPKPPLTDDASFLRRASLDLTGRIPSSDAARAFLADPDPDKRALLIDRLLASPEHARHMAITFDVIWVERRADPHVKADAWRDCLHSHFATNAPYTTLAAEVIAAEGADPKRNGPAKFLLAREVEPNALTRDVSRMFLGRDLQCAQCHDHPRIDDYTMREYYGVNAFLNRSYLFRPDKKKPGVVAENPTGEADYKSVFTQAEGRSKPRLPGDPEIKEPVIAEGSEYKVKPDKKNKNARPIPAYSRRAELAKLFARGDNRQFRRNIANRLWAHMMGRGIVEPVDFHHSDNPPTHPELLETLAEEFAALRFDMRAFLRELALSQTYQRGFDLPPFPDAATASATKQLASLATEYERAAGAASKAIKAFEQFKASIGAKRSEIDAATQSITEQEKRVKEATQARDAAKKAAEAAARPIQKRNARLASLTNAAKKAAQVAKEAKDDPELAKAAGVFETRRRQLAEEVANLEAALDARTAALNTTEKNVKTATADLQATRKRIEGMGAQLQTLQARFDDEDRKRIEAKQSASFAKQRRDAAREMIEFARLQAKAEETAGQAQLLEVALRECEQKIAKATKEAPKLAAKLPPAQAALNQALRQKHENEEAIRLAASGLANIATALNRADIGQPENGSDRATALLAKQRQHETSLAKLRAQATELRGHFLKAATTLVAAKNAVSRNAEELAAERLRNRDLSAQLKESRPARDAALAKRDAARMNYTDSLSARFELAGLTPLTPEQLCWSMLQATGETAKQTRAGAAEFDKQNPLKKDERAKFIEEYVYGKLKARERNFVSLFGSAAGSPQNAFFATPDQALFFANGGDVRGWLNPSGGNLTDRLAKLEDPAAFAEELYLAILTRKPTAPEVADVTAQLAAQGADRKTAAQELAWALLTSIEFRFRF